MERNNIIEKQRNIIIAHPRPNFAEGLKKHFEAEGVNVLGVYVVLEHLLETLHSMKNETTIKLDGLVINSSIAKRGEDKRLEYLADAIERIREDFSETSIIFLSDEMPGHPLLAELVSMGIYNIFAKSTEQKNTLDIKLLVRCIDTPLLYSDAVKYRNYNREIPWRKFVNGAQAITVNVTNQGNPKENNTPKISDQKNNQDEKKNNSIKHNVIDIDPFELEAFDIVPPQPTPTRVVERLVGKASIAVTGVTRRTGCTHLAISLATYLSRKKYEVASIECSDYPVYKYFTMEKPSRINGGFNREADFYPKSEGNLIQSIMSSHYQFIVLDLGQVANDSSSAHMELGRASSVFITMGPSEWDFHYLVHTLDMYHSLGLGHNWNVVVNYADIDTFRQIENAFTRSERDKLRIRFFRNPIQSDPFKLHPEQELFFEDSLSTIIPRREKRRFRLFY